MMKVAGVLLFATLLPLFASAQFSRNLYFGLTNDKDVVALQEFLRGRGYFTYPVSTGNYLTITLESVRRFQQDQSITPIGGYFGPQSRQAANRLLAARSSAASSPAIPSSQLPYKGKLRIGSVASFGSTAESESITIENITRDEKISITGFKIENSDKDFFIIPLGHELPGYVATARDLIILKPGDRATIAVGRQERRIDFRENLCTGHFDEFSEFRPSLSHQCPRPDTRRLIQLSDRCIRILESTPSCRTVPVTTVLDPDCSEFVTKHVSYAGCVEDYRNRSDFYSREWRIWMQRASEFFRDTHEKIILRDEAGRVVDEFTY